MELIELSDSDAPGLVVKPDVAQEQLDERDPPPTDPPVGPPPPGPGPGPPPPPPESQPKRFHGRVSLDAARVGRDASRIAEEIVSHLTGQVGANLSVVLEIEAVIPDGAPDNVVRTVTENAQTLKFEDHGFEQE